MEGYVHRQNEGGNSKSIGTYQSFYISLDCVLCLHFVPAFQKHLGDGLVAAGAQLVELDLSDNAFGPIGVGGLAALLRSRPCYTLQELRLNNNGLGITGGKVRIFSFSCNYLKVQSFSCKDWDCI